MASRSEATTALPPNRAFVLQLRHDSSLDPQRLRGRIEHVTTGRATRFDSLAQAMAFIEEVLTETKQPPAGH